ncbi:tail fiber domain-containing protein [Pedobacter sp. MR2016-24]|uniref:tail fiber domain-containing protein n=1 Tax=Pedobacter sp. MR2016-24 TaxID=2994466 RepID=UPI00224712D6|nr:tail fiber domain-containing protein [Pedobacter sp. MR2016-24]MCX2486111.1 tail fiber domain-containing protein [Pedobacter sp. MR2016-24]
MKKFLRLVTAGFLLVGNPLYAQIRLGDNLGSHKAIKNLEMQSHNINGATLINSKGMLIGTATTLSNSSIALQVDGLDKAILVPRVTDLLNPTNPSIPVANAVNGMIVYNLATAKFYYRQNNSWIAYADAAINYVDKYLPQVILGKKTFKSDSGFVAKGTFGTGIIPETGAGTRLMFYPGKAAFRVGSVSDVQWDDSNIGNYSIAMGNNVIAGALGSVAIGSYVTSGSNPGSFILGDNSTTTVATTRGANQFVARYAGGFRFYTSADTLKGFFAGPSGVLKYKGDYSAVYDDRSLVDRGYLVNNYALKTNYVDRYLQQVVLGQKTFKSDSGFVAQGTFGSGLIPVTGAGTRMMWYPRKAAFRVGSVTGTAWDDGSVANYTIAMGYNTIASSVGAISMGTSSNATGNYTTAIGNNTISSGIGSVAVGNSATASGDYSVALGRNVNGGAASSVAIGNYVNSTGAGAMSLGDNSTATAMNFNVANRFVARFAGGYRFHTSADTTRGFFAIPAGVLRYKGDYSASYDDRSLVDRAYVVANFTAKSTGSGTAGSNSLSTGSGTTASGSNSVASGSNTSATGQNSQATGQNTSATGLNSFVYGSYSSAENQETLAGGFQSHATGYNSVALGTAAVAGGSQSIALGQFVTANGNNSIAIGSNINVTQANSVGIGSYLTPNSTGVVMFGDSYNNPFGAEGDNQMLGRFAGGYVFYTAANRSTGSRLGAGSNSWSTTSDKRLKTNFETADAESFLLKIDTMKLGSWNYKTQDAKTFRHYGPMAQDFYGAFGTDSYGTIGCDTLISSADFDGVNMIAIKGLVSRTKSLTKENTDLQMRIASLESANKALVAGLVEQNEILNKKLVQQEAERNKLQADLANLQKLVEGLATAKSDLANSSMVATNGRTDEEKNGNR